MPVYFAMYRGLTCCVHGLVCENSNNFTSRSFNLKYNYRCLCIETRTRTGHTLFCWVFLLESIFQVVSPENHPGAENSLWTNASLYSVVRNTCAFRPMCFPAQNEFKPGIYYWWCTGSKNFKFLPIWFLSKAIKCKQWNVFP